MPCAWPMTSSAGISGSSSSPLGGLPTTPPFTASICMEIKNAIPVALADCSVFTLYAAAIRLDDALVIGISQSGEATDVAEYLARSKALGALTLAITNEPGSHLTQIADHTILCHAGKERGVAATKTYTSTLAALYLISECLTGECSPVEKLSNCAEAMRAALKMQDAIFEKAERYRYMTSGYVLGRGFNYCTALEIALKLAETSYLEMLGYSSADFLHGPDRGCPRGPDVFSDRAAR